MSNLLDIIQAVLTWKENESRKVHSAQKLEGDHLLNFMFDLYNDVCGYTEKYIDESVLSYEEWVEKMKPKRGNMEDPYFSEEHPHCLLAIEGAEHLSRHHDIRVQNLLDLILLRAFKDDGFRHHFPVILDTNDLVFAQHEALHMMNGPEQSFLYMEFWQRGYSAMAKAFTSTQAQFIRHYIGKSVYFHRIFTEAAI